MDLSFKDYKITSAFGLDHNTYFMDYN